MLRLPQLLGEAWKTSKAVIVRALLCSSSGGQIVLVQHLVSPFSLGDCSVHGTQSSRDLCTEQSPKESDSRDLCT